MAPESVTQERIYEAVKIDFLSGQFRPGNRIDIQAISDRHRSSTTPVREVLHRLEGERLVEHRPEGGFRLAIPDPAGLLNMYEWNARLILAAIQAAPVLALRDALRRARARELKASVMDQIDWSHAYFVSLGAASANAEAVGAIAGMSERLHYLRLAEPLVFRDNTEQQRSLVRNGYLDVRRGLGRRVAAYHRRRAKAANTILIALSRVDWDAIAAGPLRYE
jgi:DNA-binding GntR family transcriptional regulator